MIDTSSSYDQSQLPEAFTDKTSITLATEKIMVSYKIIFLDLQENHSGRYLKITEDAGGRYRTLIVPMDTAREFVETVRRIVAAVP